MAQEIWEVVIVTYSNKMTNPQLCEIKEKMHNTHQDFMLVVAYYHEMNRI